MSYTIVTDSCSNLPESIIDEYDLVVLPMVFMVDGKEYTSYLKGEVTDLKQFYTMMREGKVITTSLPNQMEARKTIASLLEAGSDVLYLGFSSALSSTYEAIKILCDDLANDYPERTLMTVDTLAASMGEGLMVVKAAERKIKEIALKSFMIGCKTIASTTAIGLPWMTLCISIAVGAFQRPVLMPQTFYPLNQYYMLIMRELLFLWKRFAPVKNQLKPLLITWHKPLLSLLRIR